MMDASKCDRCGEVALDLDTGFSPAALGLLHGGCGGAWQAIETDPEPASGPRRPAQREGVR